MNADDEFKLVTLLKENKYKEASEQIVDIIISGKKHLVEEFILHLNETDISNQKKFIETLTGLMKEKNKLKEFSSPTIELIKLIAEKNLFDLAESFIINLPVYSLRSRSYSSIAFILEKKGERNESNKYLEKAIESANKIKSLKEKSEALSPISILMIFQDRYDSSLDILENIKSDAERTFTVKKVLVKIINIKDKNRKINYLHQLANIASEITDEKLKSDCFVYITRAMIKSKMINDALELARKIQDEKAKISALGVIIDVMTKYGLKGKAKGLVEEAEQAVSHIKESDEQRSQTLSEIIKAEIKVDMIDKALSISDEVKDIGWKAMNITLIAEAMAKTGYVEKAVDLLNKSIYLIKNIQSSGTKTTVLSSVAEVLCLLDTYEESTIKPVFDNIVTVLKEIMDKNVIYAFLSYLCGLGSINKHENCKKEIIKFINSIEDEKMKNQLLSLMSKS